jgi:hypothetical protein
MVIANCCNVTWQFSGHSKIYLQKKKMFLMLFCKAFPQKYYCILVLQYILRQAYTSIQTPTSLCTSEIKVIFTISNTDLLFQSLKQKTPYKRSYVFNHLLLVCCSVKPITVPKHCCYTLCATSIIFAQYTFVKYVTRYNLYTLLHFFYRAAVAR